MPAPRALGSADRRTSAYLSAAHLPAASALRAARRKLVVCALAVVGLGGAIIGLVGSRPTAPSMLRMRGLTKQAKRPQCDDWNLGQEIARVRCPCDDCR